MKPLVAAALILLSAACAGPTTVVRTVDTRPAIALVGAPAGALVFLDGLQVGEASAFDGNPNVLRLEPGTHLVEVRLDGRTTYSERIFVESELKTLRVH